MTDREQVGVFPMVIGGEFTPHVASKIFCLLDKSALLTCRKVSREWRNLVDLETKLQGTEKRLRVAGWKSVDSLLAGL